MAGWGGSWVDKTIFCGFGGGLHLGGVGCGVEYAFIFFRPMILPCGFIFRWVGCRVVSVVNKKALNLGFVSLVNFKNIFQ